jgi:uncharacterized membrane protein YgcG
MSGKTAGVVTIYYCRDRDDPMLAIMVDTAKEDREPPAAKKQPENQERSAWSLDRDDKRMLLITVAGTVMGGVLVALIVGLAVGFDRWAYSPAHVQATSWAVLVAPVLAGVVAVALQARARKKSGKAGDAGGRSSWSRVFSWGAFGFMAVFCVLVFVGLFAGIT